MTKTNREKGERSPEKRYAEEHRASSHLWLCFQIQGGQRTFNPQNHNRYFQTLPAQYATSTSIVPYGGSLK